jgi:uncharacterized OB-fold protein
MSAAAVAERIAAEHWREEADGRALLLAARCTACGQLFLPRVAVCAACGGQAFESAPLAGPGRLYVHTVIHAAAPGFATPYAVGYVDYPEGVRVFGHVRLDGPGQPRPGVPVEVEAADLFRRPDGTPVRGYRFVPAAEDGGRA